MILSKTAINSLESRKRRLSLCLALGFTEPWINKLLAANKENGPLTTIKALEVIQAETGLKQEEILEQQQIKA